MAIVTLMLIMEFITCGIINLFSIVDIAHYEMVGYILIGITSFVIIVVASQYAENKKEYAVILLSYGFRVALLLWDQNFSDIFTLPNSGADTNYYALVAELASQNIRYWRYNTYSHVIGILYKLTGINTILTVYINLIASMFTIFLVSKMTTAFDITGKARLYAITLISLLPNYAILSVIFLRESFITFLITCSLYCFLSWIKKNSILAMVFALVFALLAAALHSGSIIILAGYAITCMFYNRKKNIFELTRSSVIVFVVCVILWIVVSTFFGDVLFAKFGVIESLSDVTDGMDSGAGGAGYSVGISLNNPILDFFINTPIRAIYFLLSPMPWDWRGLNDIIAFVFSSCFYTGTYVIAVRALRKKNIDPQKKVYIVAMLITALATAIMFAWGVKNAGTALRHRDKFVALYVVLFALSFRVLYNGPQKPNRFS